MYFESFPTIFYDANGDGTFKDVKNLLRRVGLRTLVKTNVLLFDTYEVKEGETPEMMHTNYMVIQIYIGLFL